MADCRSWYARRPNQRHERDPLVQQRRATGQLNRARTHIDVAMLVQSRQAFERRLDVLGRDVADCLRLQDAYQPPVRVGIVEQGETVALGDARLPFNRGHEVVESVDMFEIDILVRYRRR